MAYLGNTYKKIYLRDAVLINPYLFLLQYRFSCHVDEDSNSFNFLDEHAGTKVLYLCGVGLKVTHPFNWEAVKSFPLLKCGCE